MASSRTKNLVKLVEKRAGEPNSATEAQELINQGADIRAPFKNGSLIDSVIGEMNRHQSVTPWKAQNCKQLMEVLQNRASNLLAHSVLSSNGDNLSDITQLFRLRADCYQSGKFGPLGLLGELLKQDQIPIRLDTVKFLVEHDINAKFGLTNIDDQQQTCLSLANNNPKCSQDVKEFLQNTLDMILNQIPFTNPQINVSEVAEWIHRGANPEVVDQQGNTVLLNAVIANNQQLVDKLVGGGCNTAHVNKNKLTALQIAQNATPRNAQLEAILKAQNINVELKRLIETKKSLLTFDEVNSLLEKGAKINTTIANKSTLLHLLIANEGSPEMITAFVNDFNADISAMDINGYRPVEACILLDKTPFTILRTYLQLSKITTETYFNTKLNKSILQFAQDQNHPEAVKIIQDALNLRLWNLITQANTKDEHNQTLISEVNQLILYGAQIEHKHSDKEYESWTVLHLACKTTTNIFVKYLIEQHKANYTSINGNDDCPFSVAAEYGHLSIVQYLREFPNVSINVSNKDKQTPLHLATKNHHLLVVRYLVRWGADHQAQNVSKQTALDIARMNTSKSKNDETTDKTIIHFLEQLICPLKEETDQKQTQSTQPNEDLDTCELVKSVPVDPIQPTSVGDEEILGEKSLSLFFGTPNDNLIKAAKEGLLDAARTAIGGGANICYRKSNRNAYEIAKQGITEYTNQSTKYSTGSLDWQTYDQKKIGCQQIVELVRQRAYNKLLQAIAESIAYRVQAYHQAGAPLPGDLLEYSCEKSDNVQIVDYLINQSADIFQAMFNYTTNDSPYSIAKKNKFNNVASYLKYRLSVECTKAIETNDTEYVRKLARAGASVDMRSTNSLRSALGHQNAELVQILCENGAKIPIEWFQSKTIILPEHIAQTMDSDIVFRINRSLINRRLRFAAASGDLSTLIQCQHLSADINSENCYGSTALLCSIQHGNYFSIVHALVSRGATMLHSNEDELMSLIKLAEKQHYTQIMNYLSQELNTQFLMTIINNDIKSATKFEQIHADFDYRDEQNRTALHYAVQYHGFELVSWLCDRGSTATVADINGNYPMTEAAEKGDYAVVELFATKYPATKQQKNKAGQTALQIAQKQGFKRIAYLLETGKPAPDNMINGELQSEGPKYTKEELMLAAKNGQLKMIKEFIDEQYESRDDKRQLCYQLMDAAKKAKQHEVFGILKSHYEKDLKPDIPSNIEMGGVIRLNEHYKKILLGFLTGLGKVIANSPVVLDPADPNTYTNLFSDLTENQRKRSQEIHQVDSELDAKKLSNQDMDNINEKLTRINNELGQLKVEKETLEKNMEETSDKLKAQSELTAIQRQDLFKQQEEHKKQLAVYECSIFLFELQQEATITRQKTVKFIRENTNMYLFFRAIEDLLQALFHGALAARSGLFTMEKSTGYGTVSDVVGAIPSSIVPFSEPIVGAVQATVGTVLSKLDEKQQKKEYYNISTFGNIEELGRIATDTASLMTLYYKEQIQLIDTSKKIKGSNIFNHAITWIKNVVVDVRPEGKEEMPIVIVAEYVTAWIIEALKEGKKKLSDQQPLPQQLWFCVAKANCVQQGNVTALTDILGATAGRQKIPLKILKDNGEETLVNVQLRYLIGCPSLVTEDGKIYEYDTSKESSKEDFADLKLFGHVYVTPFLNSDQSSDSIVKERNLKPTSENADNHLLERLRKIEQYVDNSQNQDDRTRKSAITKETARQVAQVLREQKSFVDPKDVTSILAESRQKIEISIDVLREDIQNKTKYYQTSIDATQEQLQKDVAEARESLRKENEKHYNDALQKLNEQLKLIEKNLENRIMERMNTIEKQLKTECEDMRKIVEAAKSDANEASKQANEAANASQQSAQLAEQARGDAKKLVESTEQRRQEFQVVMDKCEANVKQTIAEQKEFCEQTITAVRTKIQKDFELTKTSAEQAAISAKESSQAAKESARSAGETQKDTRKQLDLQKEETNKTISDSKETTKQSERSANEAKDANKQAKQAADTSIAAQKKVDEMERKMEAAIRKSEDMEKKMENALERLEKLAKKLDK